MEKYTVPSDADTLNWKVEPVVNTTTIATLEVPEKLADDDIKEFGSILKDMINLYAKKNHDYGNAFEKGLAFIGPKYALSRLFDKVNRFATFSDNTEFLVKDESIEDTLIDLANYSIMSIIAIRKMRKNS